MDLRIEIYKEALYSALKNKGTVRSATLIGVMIKNNPELKKEMSLLKDTIENVCNEINSKSYEQIVEEANKLDIHFEEKEHTRKEMIELNVKEILEQEFLQNLQNICM
jgi:hypothetical protein